MITVNSTFLSAFANLEQAMLLLRNNLPAGFRFAKIPRSLALPALRLDWGFCFAKTSIFFNFRI